MAIGPETQADMNLNYLIPKASWTTPFGNYSKAGNQVYLTYHQPMVTPTAVQSGTSMVLTLTTANRQYTDTSGITVGLSGVDSFLDDKPTLTSGSCTIDATGAATCDLASSDAVITYLFPDYLIAGDVFDVTVDQTLISGISGLSTDIYTMHYVAQ